MTARFVDTTKDVWDPSVPPRKYRRARARELKMKAKAFYSSTKKQPVKTDQF